VTLPKTEVVTEANTWIEPDFSLIEHPMRVLDQKEKDPKAHRKDVQDTMESSYGRSNLGDRRVSQHQVPGFPTISKP
jgi:hypothetical protein